MRKGVALTVLMVCHRSSLLILDCMSSIIPSIGDTSRHGEDSEAELLPCWSTTVFQPTIRDVANMASALNANRDEVLVWVGVGWGLCMLGPWAIREERELPLVLEISAASGDHNLQR